jgi:hypothetical protein
MDRPGPPLPLSQLRDRFSPAYSVLDRQVLTHASMILLQNRPVIAEWSLATNSAMPIVVFHERGSVMCWRGIISEEV